MFRMEGLEPPLWPTVAQPPIEFSQPFLMALRNMQWEWPTFSLHKDPTVPTSSLSLTQHSMTSTNQPTPTPAPSASPHPNMPQNHVPSVNHRPRAPSAPTPGPSTSSAPMPGQGPSVFPQSNTFFGHEGSAQARCDSGMGEVVAPLLTYFSQGMDVLLRSIQTSQAMAQETIMKEIGTIHKQLGTSRLPGKKHGDSLAKSPKKVWHHFVATNPEGSPMMEDKQEHSAFVISHFLHSACFQPHSIARLASASIHFLCSTSRITSICGMPSVLYRKKKLKNMNKSFLDAWRSLWPTSELTVCAIRICDSTRMQLLYLLKIFLTKWWITPGMLQPKFQNVTMSMRPFTWL